MAKNTWHVVAEDGVHTVKAEHGYFSGRIKIYVDGQLVLKRFKQHSPWNLSSQHHFNLAGHDVAFYIKSPDGFKYVYDLLLDGRSITTGETVPIQPRKRVPGWGWLFAAGCVAAYIGGFWLVLWALDAHPGNYFIWHGLAVLAATYCLRVSSDLTMPLRRKLSRSLATVFATFTISAVLTGAVIHTNQAYWHSVSPTSGGYTVSVPCSAKEETDDHGTELTCQDANMRYTVWQGQLGQSARTLKPDELLTQFVDAVRHPDGGQAVEVVGEKPLVLQAYAGREYTALYKKTTVQSRIYLAGGRIYQLLVTAPGKSFSNPQAHKFLDSFHLVASPEQSQ